MMIEVVTEIRTAFVISDNGYTRTMSLPEIESWAKKRLTTISLLVQEGGCEPKLVQADKKLIKVSFTPEDEKRGH